MHLDPQSLRVATLEQFASAPADRVVVGDGWLVWKLGQRHAGTVVYGRLTGPTLPHLYRAIGATVQGGEPVTHVADVSRVRLGLLGVGVLAETPRHVDALRPLIEPGFGRSAVLLPAGAIGALVGGFVALYGATDLPTFVTTKRGEVAAWLGEDGALDAIEERLRSLVPGLDASELVAAASAFLEEEHGADLDGVARHLGVSRRSLQRALGDARIGFRDLALRARVRAGASLLAAGVSSLAEIAARLGFRSAAELAHRLEDLIGGPSEDAK